ncbi:MAG: hypothetical protein RMM29_01845 [Planctomycetota bacterium]|nr:hypothetical protein [Planctomycetota bacterium]MCX8040625.1 hypothetical protein [Planctomycetota bacterium]MDW8372379.1 hypothetical protein [Planctomycetota bacterium]
MAEAADEAASDAAIIAEARRPIVIARHRALIEEAEGGIGDGLLAEQPAQGRLAALLAELEDEGARRLQQRLLAALAEDEHYREAAVRAALIDELCLLRDESGLGVAEAQLHAIAVYRTLRRQLQERLGETLGIDALRALPCQAVARLARPLPPFGEPRLAESLVWTASFAARCQELRERLRQRQADATWHDAVAIPRLGAEAERSLAALPESERAAALAALLAERVRARFYKQVFLVYMAVDEFDPREGQAYPTLYHWLAAMEETPQLFLFLQGQTPEQKRFRIARLWQKLIQLHEIYARVAVAAQQAPYREAFAGLRMRERLSRLARDRFPPLPVTEETAIACLAYPFAAFVSWVQGLLAADDFVLPPEPKR